MIFIEVLVERTIASLISDLTVYAPQWGLDNSQKEDIYDSLMSVVWKLGEKEILVIAGHFTLKITQKTVKASMKIMVMELQRRKEKVFMNFLQLWTWQ